MEDIIKQIDPVAYAVIVLSVRFAIHAVDTVWKKLYKQIDGSRNWAVALRALAKLALTGGIPALVCVKSDVNGLAQAGAIGEALTGLSIAAIITGLHNLGKRKKAVEGIDDGTPEPGGDS